MKTDADNARAGTGPADTRFDGSKIATGSVQPGEHKETGSHRALKKKRAIIVFVKNPAPGTVKTRLAAGIGDELAMDMYLRLVAYTMTQTKEADADCFIYFSSEVPDKWPCNSSEPIRAGEADGDSVKKNDTPKRNTGPGSAFALSEAAKKHEDSSSTPSSYFEGAQLREQWGADLGQRMERAFRDVVADGYDRAVIIGSDCPELGTAHLNQALQALDDHDAVIGPARDGGYYLLGMKALHSKIFRNKQWSTESVYNHTMHDLRNAGLNTFQLPVLRDIDTIEDYRDLKEFLPVARPGNLSPLEPVISIIIPVYDEATGLKPFLKELRSVLGIQPLVQRPVDYANTEIPCEIILVDGGSTDNTVEIARETGVRCVIAPQKGRAAQMNYGAGLAAGRILYFLHADTLPPDGALRHIVAAEQQGAQSGCYRLSFDQPSRLMRFYAWFTRFDLLPFRYGDQSLFVRSDLFQRLGGFREDHIVMEDNEFIRRLRKDGSFVILEDAVVTSARKYRDNGFIRLQLIFTLIFVMYYLGAGQGTLVNWYRRLISRSKL